MSAKSTKKGKTLSVPREMAAIQKSYQEFVTKAGQLQYQIKVYGEELNSINSALLSINNEAAARQRLDADAKKSTEGATNV